jgi:hypothetical protein
VGGGTILLQEKNWDLFKTHFKSADKDLHLLATMGSLGYHGAAHVSTTADNILLAATHAKLAAAEDALAASLAHHIITPTAYVATVASNISIMTPATAAPMVPNACSYCWTHGITINIWHNSATCRDKRPGHHDEGTKSNKLGVLTHVCGGPQV